ncbi:MAG: hypothetical protein WBZ36_28940 [Candidatus Nitrosopolaris sp.]
MIFVKCNAIVRRVGAIAAVVLLLASGPLIASAHAFPFSGFGFPLINRFGFGGFSGFGGCF